MSKFRYLSLNPYPLDIHDRSHPSAELINAYHDKFASYTPSNSERIVYDCFRSYVGFVSR